MEKVFTALGILLVLIGILYLSYICTRFFGRRISGKGLGQPTKNIRVLEQKMFNQESSVALLQVSEQIFLVGITPQNISLLTEIGDKSLLKDLSLPEEDVYAPQFKDFLLRLKDRK